MKNIKPGILANAIATSLIEKVQGGKMYFSENHQGVYFHLRPSSYQGSETLVLSWHIDFPSVFSHNRGTSNRVYIRNSKRLAYTIQKVLVFTAMERVRVSYVEKLDKLCEPILAGKNERKFMKWVDKMEKVLGMSTYPDLSVEKCMEWIKEIRAWKKNLHA